MALLLICSGQLAHAMKIDYGRKVGMFVLERYFLFKIYNELEKWGDAGKDIPKEFWLATCCYRMDYGVQRLRYKTSDYLYGKKGKFRQDYVNCDHLNGETFYSICEQGHLFSMELDEVEQKKYGKKGSKKFYGSVVKTKADKNFDFLYRGGGCGNGGYLIDIDKLNAARKEAGLAEISWEELFIFMRFLDKRGMLCDAKYEAFMKHKRELPGKLYNARVKTGCAIIGVSALGVALFGGSLYYLHKAIKCANKKGRKQKKDWRNIVKSGLCFSGATACVLVDIILLWAYLKYKRDAISKAI